jgi:hypothetical protein
MDTNALVTEQIDDGQRLIGRLNASGVPVRAACWVKPAEEDRWSLYVVTPAVDTKGPTGAYREVYGVLRSLGAAWVTDSDVKLLGESSPVARQIIDLLRRNPGRSPVRSGRTMLGGVPVDEVYAYPAAQKAAGPKQAVLRFVLRSAEHPMTVMSRFLPEGKVVLNSTEWRGKEPRSCGVVSVKGPPHAPGGPEPVVYDIEVAYRPKGCITYSGGTRYDGWTAVVLDRTEDGTLLDGEGKPLPEGYPPVYRRVEVYGDADFNQIDFGEFVEELEVEGVKHVPLEEVMGRIRRSARFSASLNASFVAPRRHRPVVKIALSNEPSGIGVDGFGTHIFNIQKSAPQLRQTILDHVGEVVTGFVEGRYSVKNMSNGDIVFVELDDVLVDCAPGEEGKKSRFDCLREYLPDSYLDELAMRLMATYEVDVSVVEGPKIGLVLRRADRPGKE